MLRKSVADLRFADSRELLPSIEVDLDSIPDDYYGFGDIVARGLENFAGGAAMPRATVYVLQIESTNFHQPTFSAFFVVAGEGRALEHLVAAFKSVTGVRVRHSDSIRTKEATAQFHIQDGLVWQPEDVLTWYASPAGDQPEDSTLSDSESEKVEDAEPEFAEGGDVHVPSFTPGAEVRGTDAQAGVRFRRARSDASLGTIRRSIEGIFGLPAGSVRLCGPDGRALRSDASVGTLRKRWLSDES